jgi:hypothetical protein
VGGVAGGGYIFARIVTAESRHGLAGGGRFMMNNPRKTADSWDVVYPLTKKSPKPRFYCEEDVTFHADCGMIFLGEAIRGLFGGL